MSKRLDEQLYDAIQEGKFLKQDAIDRKKDEQIIIAARDKEWVAGGDKSAKEYGSNILIWWQQLKKDMGVNQ